VVTTSDFPSEQQASLFSLQQLAPASVFTISLFSLQQEAAFSLQQLAPASVFTISLFSLQQEAAFSLQQLAPASVLTISVLSAQQLPVDTISLPDSLQHDLPSAESEPAEVKPAGVKLSELLLFGFEPLKK
jgi:hypothetical protein